ncbi:Nop14-like family-domain-containing protein [Lanmaoa asiatica]|nr:Nop14-like family-domain-containing protein [Lanmaoa asiatica]
MGKGSQLSQLKSALSQAGVNRSNGKKKKSTPLTEHAKVKKAARLREIQQKLNPFDVKVTRLKHDVGGRKIKGTMGRPAQSKQAGMQQREKSLLKEIEQRGRVGGVIDRRFGENDPSMSLEERMLERFTRERQRASKASAFNLENEDELTHYGQSLSKLDDFDDILLPVDEEGQLDHDTVKKVHFGGFSDDEEKEDEPDRKKSKAEVMAEVIAKSKTHKMRRQMEKEQEENMRHELDQDFDSLRTLLYAPDPSSMDNDTSEAIKLPAPISANDEDTMDYDQQVRELAFDKRAKPKDRTKTEEELALEQKEALEKAEKQRRLRMLGQDPGESDDEDVGGRRKKHPRGGDDLDDDFMEDESVDGLGAGLGVELGSDASESDEGEDSDGEYGDEEADFDGFGEDNQSSIDEASDLAEEDIIETKTKRRARRSSETLKVVQELPYTFPAPESHDEFLEIIEGLPDSDVPTVVQRIRTLYHHSLGPENKLKLEDLARALIDHILYIASLPAPRMRLLSAEYFVEKLSLMHKNLKRGLATGASEPDARTWPGLSELTFLRVIGIVWPTSDMRHAVISPARLLMGAYLGLCRVRSFGDVTSGLFLSSLFLQYEFLSKRLVPEAINFVVNATLHLAPHVFASAKSLPGAFTCPDLRSALCEPLAIDRSKAKHLGFRKPDLVHMISANPTEQTKIDALGLALALLERFADMYKSLDGFIELYEPINLILSGLECGQLSEDVQSRVASLQDKITRLLKFARQSRKPLLLQAHKPIPIPSYIPKFETSSSSYIRRQDPDRERNEASKLRYQLKQERKGAIRELRKDAKFLAAVEHKKQVEKDRVYKERMNKVFSSLEGERAEQKAMDREKAREKRRAGRNLVTLRRCATRRIFDSLHSCVPATFQTPDGEDAVAPKQLLEFLRSLIQKSTADGDKPVYDRASWVTMISGLADQVYGYFPYFTSIKQGTTNERITLTHVSLDVLDHVSHQSRPIWYDGKDLVKKLFVRLLALCVSAESWLDATNDSLADHLDPTTLYSKATNILVHILCQLLASPFRREPSQRIIAHSLLWEVLGLTYDILSTSQEDFPLDIQFYSAPHLRRAPSNKVDTPVPPDNTDIIRLPSKSFLAVFCSVVADIAAKVLQQSEESRCFTHDLLRRTARIVPLTFDYCFSCPTSDVVRSRCLLRTLQAAQIVLPMSTSFRDALGILFPRLLIHKLEEGPKNPSHPSVRELASLLSNEGDSCLRLTPFHATAILGILTREEWGDAGIELRVLVTTFLRKHLDQLDSVALQAVRTFFEGNGSYSVWEEVVRDVEELQAGGRGVPEQVSQSVGWRVHAAQALRGVVDPRELEWTNNVALSDAVFARRGLQVLKKNGSQSQCRSAAVRSAIADYASAIVMQLSFCFDEGVPPAQYVLSLLGELLVGSAEDVTPVVRGGTYRALLIIVKHHAVGLFANNCTIALELVQRGVSDKDRSSRLLAGQALAQLVKVCANDQGGWMQIEGLFFHLVRFLHTGARNAIKETTLITLGLIGTDAHPQVLEEVVFHLVSQLGEHNPVLKSIALGQASIPLKLIELTKRHKKPPQGFLSPFLPRIAPFVIARKCTNPELFAEMCQFLGVYPNSLLSITRPHALPHLFAEREVRVLEEIASELGKKLSILFLGDASQILAHVFRLQGPGQTNQALDFVVKIVRADADEVNRRSIDIRGIVHSNLLPLLADLMVVLGNENPDDAASVNAHDPLPRLSMTFFGSKAVSALRKVGRIMSFNPMSQDNGNAEMVHLLKTNLLGIVSYMSEMLQDIRGKKTTPAKRQIIRAFGALIVQIRDALPSVATQIMATLQTMSLIPELTDVTLSTWLIFLKNIAPLDVGPHIVATSATIASLWPSLSPTARETAKECLRFIVFDIGDLSGGHLDEVVDLRNIPELSGIHQELMRRRASWDPREKIQKILAQLNSDNYAITLHFLGELKTLMSVDHPDFVRSLASGDAFDPLVGKIQSSLFHIASRDGDDIEGLRLLAFESMGILGAADPDRCEIGSNDSRMVVRSNFTDESEAVLFAMHLIKDVLVGTFRSTSDIKYQGRLSYSIQELLRFCGFTSALVAPKSTVPVPVKVRNRWSSLPKHILEMITPMLEGRFQNIENPLVPPERPIYPRQNTYREWLQLWTTYLISRASGETAKRIFGVLRPALRNKDVGVAHHLLPHLVLNILLSGEERDIQDIREELLAVLEDQVDERSPSSADKKFLSAQVVFTLLDHVSKYVRILRQDISSKKAENNKRSRANTIGSESEEQLVRIDSMLSSINHDLMAKAALQCKAYARSMMNFERQVVALRERETPASTKELTPHYERLHEIYAHLDEPDGMEGISMLILSPSLEHKIRQHESTGQWTAAQSCWEVRLQQSPDNLEFHLGLLRCLRNLGHYDTLRTHVRGVLVRNPDWESALAGFQAESAWMMGAWDDLQQITANNELTSPYIMKARVLLAMRAGDAKDVASALSNARAVLGAPITAAGAKGYRQSYDALLDLHMIHEMELIYDAISATVPRSQSRREAMTSLGTCLAARFDATLPNFRVRQAVLSMRRTAFALRSERRIRCSRFSSRVLTVASHSPNTTTLITKEIGQSWIASAKIARKAKQWQTAYSATLQAQQSNARFYFMESAKLVKATGEPLRALQELENSMRLSGLMEDPNTIDLTGDDDAELKRVRAKASAHILRARWMNESDRYEPSQLLKAFQIASGQGAMMESALYHLGRFHDQSFKQLAAPDEERSIRMNAHTVRNYAKAVGLGSKYVYQAIPRMLTLWLDFGENSKAAAHPVFLKIHAAICQAVESVPAYKARSLYTNAFPQIVSRVGHTNQRVYHVLSKIISKVIREYPHQALWLFASVVKSTKPVRESRGRAILDALRSDPTNADTELPILITQLHAMTEELLKLCNYPIDDDRKTLSMKREFTKLALLGKSKLLIPLQESLTANLPPASSTTENSTHVPFPSAAPTFEEFSDEIEIMRSLAKPRKITIRGSNGQTYMFLGKPKDDLRKDARLMDFNAIINKLLKANSESRRRQLHVRTYGVVTLNEECGFIQWVPNTIPIRPVLIRHYEARRIKNWVSTDFFFFNIKDDLNAEGRQTSGTIKSTEMSEVFRKIKEATEKDAAELFTTKILPIFPPVFHEWFVETFPEPSAWLSSRLMYGRTAAVMSMVGFILGLGDRHCENILLDTNTGDVVHVDFNCLFEKGKTLEVPERVPFRLTQNMIDGLGVTGVEGVFRIACEMTMQLLRDNKDSLMSVLDAFIHDPLVEWEDEKRKMDRDRRNAVRSSTDLHHLAKNALRPIERKLRGVYSPSNIKSRNQSGSGGSGSGEEREISTSNLVEMLIQEAIDDANLAKMYPGWGAWH